MYFDHSWEYVQTGIARFKRILEGFPDDKINAHEYMMYYTTVYNMYTLAPQELVAKYEEAFVEFIEYMEEKHPLFVKNDEFLLEKLVHRWSNHKKFVGWLSGMSPQLDRHIAIRNKPSLNTFGLSMFSNMVYKEVKANAWGAVITLINKEREGEEIDRQFLKNVFDTFIEMGIGEMQQSKQDFEVQILDETGDYYKSKAKIWIESHSCPQYMQNAKNCLKQERDRVSHYLPASIEKKLIEKVQHELLVNNANQLFENKHSGLRALLRDDKVDDLSLMYELYHEIPKGLDPIANLFKQCITDEGTALVQRVEESASNQVLVREFMQLHDKYMLYVNNCFMDHTLFRKALKEAFEVEV